MKISEVSEQSGLSVDTLRYYEKIGLLPPVNRTDSGIRDYSELDVRRVDFIKCMRMRFGDTPTGKQEMIALLHKAVERGITFFDTAEVYSPSPTKNWSAKR